MPGTTGTKVTFFAAGVLAGGLVVGGAFLAIGGSGADDEERPPIIVRGGSIVFESGDKNSNKPKEKNGKKWASATTYWQPDQPHGISVSDLTVAIRGGNQASCPALDRVPGNPPTGMPEVNVTYRVNQTESSFKITLVQDPNNAKKYLPIIVGSNMRQENDTSNNPQLVFGNHGEGEISRVQFRGQSGNVNCDGPITALKVWQDK